MKDKKQKGQKNIEAAREIAPSTDSLKEKSNNAGSKGTSKK